MLRSTLSLLAAAMIAAVSAAPATAQSGADATTLTRPEIEVIIREYLIENPEVLEEAFTALQVKRQQAADARRLDALASMRDELENSPHGAVIGNPEGDITLVEFFDYNCGYCRRAMSDLDTLIETNPNLRVVLKELPVLGEGSVRAAAVSIAVNNVAPEAYREFHNKLLSVDGRADDAAALSIVDAMGLPRAEIEATMRSDAVGEAVNESRMLAELLQIEGTPSYVIGDVVEQGAVGVEQLQARINQSQCGQDVC